MDTVAARRREQRDAFHRLFDLAPERREDALSRIGGSDAALEAELRELLAEADLDAAAARADDRSQVDQAGRVVSGRFRLLSLLGSGGMGEVYLAERTDDVEQKVALKLVREDLPIPAQRARRERQILARLAHPNIAGLVDAGLTESGRPWFAMEYVDGERITDWCDHAGLDLRRRARLFAQVCRAVQFAHRSLVLHRDIKPSNLLVDHQGAPKLLDFGIAKLLDATDAQQTQTLALTPAYAAPEQLRGEIATTSSDVYQLGLVLYELVAGVSARRTREALGWRAEQLPRVDQAFPLPGARDDSDPVLIAQHRGSGVDRLRRLLKGDIGRIVAKATAADPKERYDTAQAMADDLERWSDGLPVAAHRGSMAYRARKLIRRHAVASTMIAALSVGLVGSSLFALNRAHIERLQRERAEEQKDLADEQRRRAETLLGFLRDVFQAASPDESGGAHLEAKDLLSRATANLAGQARLDDVARSVLSTEVADVLSNLGQAGEALTPARQAEQTLRPLRERHPQDYLRAVAVLADALNESGDYRAVVDLVSGALPLAARSASGEHQWSAYLRIQSGIALVRLQRPDEADAQLQMALREFAGAGVEGGSDLGTLLNVMAGSMSARGDFAQALTLYQRERAVQQGNAHAKKIDLLINEGNIANAYCRLGRSREGIDSAVAMVPRFDALLGADRDRSVLARVILARCYESAGDLRNASLALSAAEAAARGNAALGSGTRRELRIGGARLALLRRDPDAAARLLPPESVVDAATEAASARSVQLALLRAEVRLQQGDAVGARDRFTVARRDALRIRPVHGGPLLAEIEDALGRCEVALRRPREALPHFEAALGAFGDGDPAASAAALRAQAHVLWANQLVDPQPESISRLVAVRTALVGALGGDASIQVAELDLLIERLSPPAQRDAGMRERARAAEARLRQLGVASPRLRSGGLSRLG